MTEPESAPEDLSKLKEEDDNYLEHGQVGGFHINFSNLSRLRNSILAAIATEVADQSGLASAGTNIAAFVSLDAIDRVKKLRPDEVVALDALRSLAAGGRIYSAWVGEEQVVDRLAHERVGDVEMSEDAARRLLSSMKSRGILEEGAGQWRAVW